MPPAKQNTDMMFTCNYCSSKYAHKGSLNTHVKNKHKEEIEAKIINDMTKFIVEDVVNEVTTRENPKTKFTLTNHDLDRMIGDIAEKI